MMADWMNVDAAAPSRTLPNFFRRRAAGARALAMVCLLAALPLTLAPWIGHARLSRLRSLGAGAGVGMILCVAIASWVTARRLKREARRLDHSLARLAAGQFMVRWTYSAALWDAWSATVSGHQQFTAEAPSIVPAVTAAVAVAAAAGCERDRAAALMTAGAAAMAATLAVLWRGLAHMIRIRRQSPGARECFIANDMLYFDEQAIFFSSHESRLASADYHAGDIPELRLRIVLLDHDGDDIRTMVLRIPVPPRGGSAARRVTTRLRRRFDPASVHLTGRHPHHKLIHHNPAPILPTKPSPSRPG
jgi:hypothetical protein